LYPNDGLLWLLKSTFSLMANLNGKHSQGKIPLSQITFSVALIFFFFSGTSKPSAGVALSTHPPDGHPGSSVDHVLLDSSPP